MKYSLIVPVYNRPDEIEELLESLTFQTEKNFEVVIVEDGSSVSCESIVKNYESKLSISYFLIPNGGPGQARNYGASKSSGEYVIVLDSDCVIPPNYIESVTKELNATQADVFGGPDNAADNFSSIQKAINYSMTSFFTTGGIRGGKKKMDKFYPRSFNMGIRKEVYDKLGGFSKMRFGEDIDFSIRIYQANYKVELFSSAWVYHKRRTDLKKFYKQVYNSGIARINLYKKYPKSLKLVHVFPCIFTIGLILFPILFPIYILYFLMIFFDALFKTKNIKVACLSIASSFVQLFAYGCGFINAFWNIVVKKRSKKSAFEKTFYD